VKVGFLLKRLLLNKMNVHEKYMQRCIELAHKGLGLSAPNPSVGAVLVHKDSIIGEGFTSPYGGNHAEVNCIHSVKDDDHDLIKLSTLYVSLEPCSHYGKTPPCSKLIIEKKIPEVVIGCVDIFKEVNGLGIQQLKQAGINVITPILEKEAIQVNKRFFTYHSKKRPYVILKWAETEDGFIDLDRSENLLSGAEMKLPSHSGQGSSFNNWITTPKSKKLVHEWRSIEQAIMVGTTTAINDDPALTVREVSGKNPLRVVLDLNLRLPHSLKLFDQSVSTLVFNYQKAAIKEQLEFIKIDKNQDLLPQILNHLYLREIQSIIIEGGAQLLNTFIAQNYWDEARVFKGEKKFKKGLAAPTLSKKAISTESISTDTLSIYIND